MHVCCFRGDEFRESVACRHSQKGSRSGNSENWIFCSPPGKFGFGGLQQHVPQGENCHWQGVTREEYGGESQHCGTEDYLIQINVTIFFQMFDPL